MKKEKEKEPEKAEKQEAVGMLRKKGFELERKDSDDSDDVRTLPIGGKVILFFYFIYFLPVLNIWTVFYLQEAKPDVPKLSKKKLRRMNRLTVAELKQVNHSCF